MQCLIASLMVTEGDRVLSAVVCMVRPHVLASRRERWSGERSSERAKSQFRVAMRDELRSVILGYRRAQGRRPEHKKTTKRENEASEALRVFVVLFIMLRKSQLLNILIVMLNYHGCLVIQSSSSNQLISHINNHLFERPRKKLISNTSQSEILQLDASAEKIKFKIL